ncbi:MAG: S8 family serine peptidase [Phycisphaerales bacterium]|nr:S8 family serine peptidase [Phycisphaerales bacterium]
MSKSVRRSKALLSCLSAASALALVSGSALAIDTPAKQGSASAQGTTLNTTQRRVASEAFNWLDRDAGLLDAVITPRTTFTAIPGSMERNGRLAAKVKDRSDMIEEIARGFAQEKLDNPDAFRGAAADQAADLQQLVDARMQEARDRLAPSLIEGFMDVDVHTFWLPGGMTEEQMAEILMRTGDYEYVEPDWQCFPHAVPNDPSYNSQWWHKANRIDSERAWDYNTGTNDIIVAVCDTGVDLDHPDLAAGIVNGFNSATNLAQIDGGVVSDYFGHGSMVAGCAAAQGNNGTGVAGVGWNFKIMPIRVTNAGDGTAPISDILQGARWASDEGAYAVNCSYGGASSSQTNTTGNQIRNEGHLLVFSSGNDGIVSQTNDWLHVTIVGASTQGDSLANFSETGVGVDVIAPGTNIFTTNRFGGYSTTQGTSFSSPITAGSLALIHSANPALSADEVEQLLFDNCEDKGTPGEDNQTGWGRINVGGSVFDAIFGPSITSLPFSDGFATDTLDDTWKNPVGTVEVNSDADNEPSGEFSMNLDATDSIETLKLRAGFLQTNPAEVAFSVQHKGVESGKSLLVEYFNVFDAWTTLTTLTSDGVDQSVFARHRIDLPLFGKHDGLKLRFTAQGADSTDDWYIDDVLVQAFDGPNALPWSDNFEAGIQTPFDWSSSDAAPSTDATNAPAGPTAAELTNSDSMVTHSIAANTTASTIYIRVYSQHKGVESGESLTVEYLNAFSVWNTIGTIVSDGIDQNSFDLNQYPLPFDGFTAELQVRITADGDESDDRWFIDDVAVTTEFVEEVTECPADFTGDGSLDIFDVFAFLDAFNASDPSADFTNDGAFDIFDVFAFLDAFNAGCP